MQRVNLVLMSLLLGVVFSIVFSTSSFSADEGMKTIKGNVVCLIPNFRSGTVQTIIATHSCDKLPVHQHVLVTENAVYSLQGLQAGLMRIEQSPKRHNVTIVGRVEGSRQTGWVLFVR